LKICNLCLEHASCEHGKAASSSKEEQTCFAGASFPCRSRFGNFGMDNHFENSDMLQGDRILRRKKWVKN